MKNENHMIAYINKKLSIKRAFMRKWVHSEDVKKQFGPHLL